MPANTHMMQNDMMQANKPEDMGWEFVDDTLTNAQHTVVFVTPRGRRYHARSGCSDARLSLSESEALQIGRSPCKKCCKSRIAI